MSLNVASLAKSLFHRFTKKMPQAAQKPNRACLCLTALEDRTTPTAVVSVAAVSDAYEGGNIMNGLVGRFHLTRTETSGFLTVNYSFSGTASSGDIVDPFFVQFNDGESTADLVVSAVDDSTSEPTETITFNINSGTGYTVGSPSSATINLFDNDAQSVSVAQVNDAVEGGTAGQFLFTRIGDLSSLLSANFSVSGTATSGTDFTALGTALNFAAGTSAVSVNVATLADNAVEGSETVVATVGSGTGYSVGSPSSATVTITDDPPVITAAALTDAVEDSSDGTFRFTRSGGDTTSSLTIDYEVEGTAIPDTNYTALSGSVTFAANSTTADVTVAQLDDNTPNFDTSVVVYVLDTASYTAGENSDATVVIQDTDTPLVSVATVNDAMKDEWNGEFWFARKGDTSSSLTVNLSVSGTATSGTDYTALGTSVTFSAGEAFVSVPVEALTQTGETIILSIQSGTGYAVDSGAASATLTVLDEAPVVWIDSSPTSVAEGDSDTIVLKRSGGDLSKELTVSVYIGSGSGTAPLWVYDYTVEGVSNWSGWGQVTFAANSDTVTLGTVSKMLSRVGISGAW